MKQNEQKLKSFGRKIKNWLTHNAKYHIVDSTALLVASHPIFTAFETCVAGMSDEVSIDARLYISGLTYAGLGWIVGQGRDLSRKIFNITDTTKERIQQLHDSAYLAAINIPLGVALYTAAGETDLKKIAIGTGTGVLFGAFMGPWIGYAIDAFRDLTGLQSCERRLYPDLIRGQRPTVKKGLAAIFTAASIGLMGVIYSLTPNKTETSTYKALQAESTITTSVERSQNSYLESIVSD